MNFNNGEIEMSKTLTIYDIKELTRDTAPEFFTRETLKYFGQTMKDFKVTQIGDKYRIASVCRNTEGVQTGRETIRIFNPKTNELELI